MITVKYLIYYILFSAVIFIGCAQTDEENVITVEQLREMMRSDSSLVLLDVRNPHELENKTLGHIDGVLNIPLPELEKRLGDAIFCLLGSVILLKPKKDVFHIALIAN